MGLILNKFHHHGGLSYLRISSPHPENADGSDGYQLFPMFLRSYSHGVTAEGDSERQVRGTFTLNWKHIWVFLIISSQPSENCTKKFLLRVKMVLANP